MLIYAKTDELLSEHTENVVNVWTELKSYYSSDFSNDFWEDTLFAVVFHDCGKVINNFQNMIHSIQNNQRRNFDNNIRHELLSGLILFSLNPNYYVIKNLPIFSIFSHHKSLNNELFIDETSKNLEMNKENIVEFFKFAFELLEKNNIDVSSFQLKSERIADSFSKTDIEYIYKKFKNFYENSISYWNEKKRLEYINQKSILYLSDWLASGHKNLPKNLSYNIDGLKNILNEFLKSKKNVEFLNFKEFQLESLTKKNVIAIAPTGSGKTEAALLWASLKENNSRIVYLLPTRVTSNAIYERLKSYFDDDLNQVALIHSSAISYQKLTRENNKYDGNEYLLDKVFFKNISVATIDQVLTSGFNLGYWELKTFHLLNAKVIIDEIHLYSPYTLGLIVSTIEYLLINFNTTFYLMSATMPKKLVSLLSKIFKKNKKEIKIIEDKQLLDSARNTFIVIDDFVDSHDNLIIENYKSGKKVLLVVNTVSEAIRLNNKYEDLNPICYHSRFIVKDRAEKEKEIYSADKYNKPCLLIATQVVEVCLDIDFDVLFTENAPIDAIIQRAGRINRKRNPNKDSKVYIFKHNDITNYVYADKNILNNSFNLLKEINNTMPTESKLIELVDNVYENYDVENDKVYLDAKSLYKRIQVHHKFILDNNNEDKVYTREGLDSVSIIPMQFMQELQEKPFYIKSLYEVSLSNYNFKKFNKEKDNYGFTYLDVGYNYRIGISLEEEFSSNIESRTF